MTDRTMASCHHWEKFCNLQAREILFLLPKIFSIYFFVLTIKIYLFEISKIKK